MTQYDRLMQEMTIDKMTCLLRDTVNLCCDYCIFKDDNCGCGGGFCYIGIKQFLESEVRSDE